MAGYIGSKSSVTQVDGYTEAEADAEFVTKTGDTLTGDLSFGDNDKAIFGAGDDLQIYHDGSNSYIKDVGTGNLTISANQVVVKNAASNEAGILFTENSAVELYHDDSKKLATTSTGVAVTGSTAHTAGDITNTISGTYNLNGANGTAGSPAYATYSFKDDPNTGMYRAAADTLTFATAGSERMRLDASGRVTMPYQPAFCTTGNTASFSGVTFKGTVLLNNGNYYSTSSGKFTAPVAGIYAFSFNLTTEDTNSHFTYISVNGGNANGYQLSYGVTYQSATQNIVVSLSAGDYVEGKRRATGYSVYRANFSGHLIG